MAPRIKVTRVKSKTPKSVAPQQAMRASRAVTTQTDTGCIVKHTEFLVSPQITVPPAGNWGASYLLNPMNPLCFPWLSKVASMYEMYRFVNLKFDYLPSVPTTAAGSLAMYIDYDPTDDNSALSFEQIAAMARCKVGQIYMEFSESFREAMTVMHLHKYYCSAVSTADRLSDVGKVWFKTSGATAFPVTGRIMVSYTVEFFTPQQPGTILANTGVATPAASQDLTTIGQTNLLVLGIPEAVSVAYNIAAATVAVVKTSYNIVKNVSAFISYLRSSALPGLDLSDNQGLAWDCPLEHGKLAYETWLANRVLVPMPENDPVGCVVVNTTANDLMVDANIYYRYTSANTHYPYWHLSVSQGWKVIEAISNNSPQVFVADAKTSCATTHTFHLVRDGATGQTMWFSMWCEPDKGTLETANYGAYSLPGPEVDVTEAPPLKTYLK